ncbi:hypothetical protein [Amycolatopsis albispora]|uniref:hypothetical protein n=1 Tax=Amycolatopsis albispora TaxID=1804986 RepID=UPI0013B39647|nr:hypothetical protein [Amycolatopsis albispora]
MSEGTEMETAPETQDDTWLAEQAQEALSAIASLHDEAIATLSPRDTGWFDTEPESPAQS